MSLTSISTEWSWRRSCSKACGPSQAPDQGTTCSEQRSTSTGRECSGKVTWTARCRDDGRRRSGGRDRSARSSEPLRPSPASPGNWGNRSCRRCGPTSGPDRHSGNRGSSGKYCQRAPSVGYPSFSTMKRRSGLGNGPGGACGESRQRWSHCVAASGTGNTSTRFAPVLRVADQKRRFGGGMAQRYSKTFARPIRFR